MANVQNKTLFQNERQAMYNYIDEQINHLKEITKDNFQSAKGAIQTNFYSMREEVRQNLRDLETVARTNNERITSISSDDLNLSVSKANARMRRNEVRFLRKIIILALFKLSL